ncbi:HK97 family phage prohead protease [Labilibacter sediminis]|nr:HK97 family phage prohead protease [Labilibacter sediminis]
MKENKNDNLLENISIRSNENGENIIDGYGSVFNQKSRRLVENGKVFYEIIHTGAFDDCDFSNAIMCLNHDKRQMLARTKSGTLTLTVDEYGLKYSFTLPNTTLGNDTKEQVSRNDYDESSFAFIVDQKSVKWERDSEGNLIRNVHKIKRVTDCSIVLNGAYANTDISLRDLKDVEDKIDTVVEEYQRDYTKELELIKLKYK